MAPRYTSLSRVRFDMNKILHKGDQRADELIPPAELIFDGAGSVEEFISTGEGFTRHFLLGRAQLGPDDRVLDVGCGIGQKARVLVEHLSEKGSYEGFDIVAKGIDWCQEHYQRYPNFRFQLADIYSKHFNPEGQYQASEYRFPYADGEFDLVFLSSVFTHMLPPDVKNYFAEIARVLKPGGRCVITFFLLNPESLRRIDAGLNPLQVPFEYDYEGCRIGDLDIPEAMVAYDERLIRSLFDKHGLSVTEITFGSWCGREEFWGCFQDVVIAMKESRGPLDRTLDARDAEIARLKAQVAAYERGRFIRLMKWLHDRRRRLGKN